MFGKNSKKDNPFISRMTGYMNSAMECSYHKVSCAEEIKPMIKDFFKKSMSAEVNWEDCGGVCWHIENITEAVQYLAENTRNYERMSEEDFKVFQKIFEEFDVLHDEALKLNSQSEYKDYLSYKISCITEILCKNHVGMHDSEEQHEYWRDGMIFQNYENLWKVIHRVNTEWDDLRSRGFSLRVFYDFWDVFKYDRSRGEEMSEKEKIKTFMALLDGKMKFIPVYRHEYRPIGFKVVDNDFDDEIVYTSDAKNNKSHRMRQVGEEATPCATTEE